MAEAAASSQRVELADGSVYIGEVALDEKKQQVPAGFGLLVSRNGDSFFGAFSPEFELRPPGVSVQGEEGDVVAFGNNLGYFSSPVNAYLGEINMKTLQQGGFGMSWFRDGGATLFGRFEAGGTVAAASCGILVEELGQSRYFGELVHNQPHGHGCLVKSAAAEGMGRGGGWCFQGEFRDGVVKDGGLGAVVYGNHHTDDDDDAQLGKWRISANGLTRLDVADTTATAKAARRRALECMRVALHELDANIKPAVDRALAMTAYINSHAMRTKNRTVSARLSNVAPPRFPDVDVLRQQYLGSSANNKNPDSGQLRRGEFVPEVVEVIKSTGKDTFPQRLLGEDAAAAATATRAASRVDLDQAQSFRELDLDEQQQQQRRRVLLRAETAEDDSGDLPPSPPPQQEHPHQPPQHPVFDNSLEAEWIFLHGRPPTVVEMELMAEQQQSAKFRRDNIAFHQRDTVVRDLHRSDEDNAKAHESLRVAQLQMDGKSGSKEITWQGAAGAVHHAHTTTTTAAASGGTHRAGRFVMEADGQVSVTPAAAGEKKMDEVRAERAGASLPATVSASAVGGGGSGAFSRSGAGGTPATQDDDDDDDWQSVGQSRAGRRVSARPSSHLFDDTPHGKKETQPGLYSSLVVDAEDDDDGVAQGRRYQTASASRTSRTMTHADVEAGGGELFSVRSKLAAGKDDNDDELTSLRVSSTSELRRMRLDEQDGAGSGVKRMAAGERRAGHAIEIESSFNVLRVKLVGDNDDDSDGDTGDGVTSRPSSVHASRRGGGGGANAGVEEEKRDYAADAATGKRRLLFSDEDDLNNPPPSRSIRFAEEDDDSTFIVRSSASSSSSAARNNANNANDDDIELYLNRHEQQPDSPRAVAGTRAMSSESTSAFSTSVQSRAAAPPSTSRRAADNDDDRFLLLSRLSNPEADELVLRPNKDARILDDEDDAVFHLLQQQRREVNAQQPGFTLRWHHNQHDDEDDDDDGVLHLLHTRSLTATSTAASRSLRLLEDEAPPHSLLSPSAPPRAVRLVGFDGEPVDGSSSSAAYASMDKHILSQRRNSQQLVRPFATADDADMLILRSAALSRSEPEDFYSSRLSSRVAAVDGDLRRSSALSRPANDDDDDMLLLRSAQLSRPDAVGEDLPGSSRLSRAARAADGDLFGLPAAAMDDSDDDDAVVLRVLQTSRLSRPADSNDDGLLLMRSAQLSRPEADRLGQDNLDLRMSRLSHAAAAAKDSDLLHLRTDQLSRPAAAMGNDDDLFLQTTRFSRPDAADDGLFLRSDQLSRPTAAAVDDLFLRSDELSRPASAAAVGNDDSLDLRTSRLSHAAATDSNVLYLRSDQLSRPAAAVDGNGQFLRSDQLSRPAAADDCFFLRSDHQLSRPTAAGNDNGVLLRSDHQLSRPATTILLDDDDVHGHSDEENRPVQFSRLASTMATPTASAFVPARVVQLEMDRHSGGGGGNDNLHSRMSMEQQQFGSPAPAMRTMQLFRDGADGTSAASSSATTLLYSQQQQQQVSSLSQLGAAADDDDDDALGRASLLLARRRQARQHDAAATEQQQLVDRQHGVSLLLRPPLHQNPPSSSLLGEVDLLKENMATPYSALNTASNSLHFAHQAAAAVDQQQPVFELHRPHTATPSGHSVMQKELYQWEGAAAQEPVNLTSSLSPMRGGGPTTPAAADDAHHHHPHVSLSRSSAATVQLLDTAMYSAATTTPMRRAEDGNLVQLVRQPTAATPLHRAGGERRGDGIELLRHPAATAHGSSAAAALTKDSSFTPLSMASSASDATAASALHLPAHISAAARSGTYVPLTTALGGHPPPSMSATATMPLFNAATTATAHHRLHSMEMAPRPLHPQPFASLDWASSDSSVPLAGPRSVSLLQSLDGGAVPLYRMDSAAGPHNTTWAAAAQDSSWQASSGIAHHPLQRPTTAAAADWSVGAVSSLYGMPSSTPTAVSLLHPLGPRQPSPATMMDQGARALYLHRAENDSQAASVILSSSSSDGGAPLQRTMLDGAGYVPLRAAARGQDVQATTTGAPRSLDAATTAAAHAPLRGDHMLHDLHLYGSREDGDVPSTGGKLYRLATGSDAAAAYTPLRTTARHGLDVQQQQHTSSSNMTGAESSFTPLRMNQEDVAPAASRDGTWSAGAPGSPNMLPLHAVATTSPSSHHGGYVPLGGATTTQGYSQPVQMSLIGSSDSARQTTALGGGYPLQGDSLLLPPHSAASSGDTYPLYMLRSNDVEPAHRHHQHQQHPALTTPTTTGRFGSLVYDLDAAAAIEFQPPGGGSLVGDRRTAALLQPPSGSLVGDERTSASAAWSSSFSSSAPPTWQRDGQLASGSTAAGYASLSLDQQHQQQPSYGAGAMDGRTSATAAGAWPLAHHPQLGGNAALGQHPQQFGGDVALGQYASSSSSMAAQRSDLFSPLRLLAMGEEETGGHVAGSLFSPPQSSSGAGGDYGSTALRHASLHLLYPSSSTEIGILDQPGPASSQWTAAAAGYPYAASLGNGWDAPPGSLRWAAHQGDSARWGIPGEEEEAYTGGGGAKWPSSSSSAAHPLHGHRPAWNDPHAPVGYSALTMLHSGVHGAAPPRGLYGALGAHDDNGTAPPYGLSAPLHAPVKDVNRCVRFQDESGGVPNSGRLYLNQAAAAGSASFSGDERSEHSAAAIGGMLYLTHTPFGSSGGDDASLRTTTLRSGTLDGSPQHRGELHSHRSGRTLGGGEEYGTTPMRAGQDATRQSTTTPKLQHATEQQTPTLRELFGLVGAPAAAAASPYVFTPASSSSALPPSSSMRTTPARPGDAGYAPYSFRRSLDFADLELDAAAASPSSPSAFYDVSQPLSRQEHRERAKRLAAMSLGELELFGNELNNSSIKPPRVSSSSSSPYVSRLELLRARLGDDDAAGASMSPLLYAELKRSAAVEAERATAAAPGTRRGGNLADDPALFNATLMMQQQQQQNIVGDATTAPLVRVSQLTLNGSVFQVLFDDGGGGGGNSDGRIYQDVAKGELWTDAELGRLFGSSNKSMDGNILDTRELRRKICEWGETRMVELEASSSTPTASVMDPMSISHVWMVTAPLPKTTTTTATTASTTLVLEEEEEEDDDDSLHTTGRRARPSSHSAKTTFEDVRMGGRLNKPLQQSLFESTHMGGQLGAGRGLLLPPLLMLEAGLLD